MEKILLNKKGDVTKAVTFFGKKYKDDIKKVIREFPCMLIGMFSDDVEFGAYYNFSTVIKSDFRNEPGTVIH